MKNQETLSAWIEHTVEMGTTSVEKIHKAIAGLPLEVIERNGLWEDAAQDVRKLQEQSIGAVYDVIREVNHQVAEFAADLLGETQTTQDS